MISDAIRNAVAEALASLGPGKGAAAAFAVEHPDDLSHGDYSTNAALVFSKELKMKPRELAERLVPLLQKADLKDVEKIDIAGPGFVNFHLKREFFAGKIADILKNGEKFGSGDFFKKEGLGKVMVEYTDPNPFKEFHIGHLMSNAIGESVSRLVAFSGAEVKRACYQGDVGLHVAKAVWGWMKEGGSSPDAAKLGSYYARGANAYDSDENAKQEIVGINKKIYSREDKKINETYDLGRKISLDYFNSIYKKLGTKFDHFFFESEAGPIGKKLVKENVPGVFEESDGAVVFNGDKDKGLHTRVFINSQELPTYEAKELGLIRLKLDAYKYDLSLVVTGNEIRDYFRVLVDAAARVFPKDVGEKANIRHVPHGMLRLPTGKMSSRTGDVITAMSLVLDLQKKINDKFKKEASGSDTEAVAVAAIKYAVLRQSSVGDVIFDLDKSLSFEGDSGPYLQYSAVRAGSVGEKAKEARIKESAGKAPAEAHPIERLLYRFPEVVERAAREYEPHYVTTYLTELAGSFNNFYANNQIAAADDPSSPYRIALTHAFRTVMENGLNLLGIRVPDRM